MGQVSEARGYSRQAVRDTDPSGKWLEVLAGSDEEGEEKLFLAMVLGVIFPNG